jgi:hypothetical protein
MCRGLSFAPSPTMWKLRDLKGSGATEERISNQNLQKVVGEVTNFYRFTGGELLRSKNRSRKRSRSGHNCGSFANNVEMEAYFLIGATTLKERKMTELLFRSIENFPP